MAILRERVYRKRLDALACAVGLGLAGMAALVADRHPRLDRWLFASLNHHEAEPAVMRLVQQLGTPWVLPSTAIVALATGRRRLALAAMLGLPVEKALEVGIKKLRPTARPLYVEPTVLRDDAPVGGESFPSGHAAIAFTAVRLVAPYLPRRLYALLYACAALSAGVRISQGAHHPLDLAGGVALGVGTGAGLTYVVGRER